MAKPGSKCYLDSNVLIYYLQRESPLHLKARRLLIHAGNKDYDLYLSPLCIDEFLYNFPGSIKDKTLGLKTILKITRLYIINPPADTSSQLKITKLMNKYHLGPRDAYHLLICQYHKITYFATFDHDFDSVFASQTLKQFLVVLPNAIIFDPLSS